MVEKKVAKKDKKICSECSKYIDIKKDYHVQILTLNRFSKKDDHAYFHFACWGDYFNKCVEKKMRNQVAFMQEKAISLFNSPQLKPMFDQIQGSGLLLNMIKIPLKKDIELEIIKEKIEEKIKDDRKKRNRKNTKTQMQKM
jgi:hypothetical protein